MALVQAIHKWHWYLEGDTLHWEGHPSPRPKSVARIE